MPSDLGGAILPLPAPAQSPSKSKTVEVLAPGQRWREIGEELRAMQRQAPNDPTPAPRRHIH